jgi:lipopolysaccharide export LptBFGC system permease protein LptF
MNFVVTFVLLTADILVYCYLQVVPWGFRKLLNWIAKEYNNPPVLIAENGFSDRGELNDRDRVDYLIVSGSNSGLLAKVV